MDAKPTPGLDGINPEKRDTLKKLAAGAAFAAPIVLSFSVGGLSVSDVRAYVGGGGGGGNPPTSPPHGYGDGNVHDNAHGSPRTGNAPPDPPRPMNLQDKGR